MPPKRSLKDEIAAEKKRVELEKRLKEQRERNIERISEESKQSSLRAAILEESQSIFEELLTKVRSWKKSLKQEAEMKKMVKIPKLCNTSVPAEVRGFLYYWRERLTEHREQQINWWLQCNDRSLLTQDPSVEDTRRVQMKKLRKKTGKFYDVELRRLLKLYNSLMDSLRRRKMSVAYYEDLLAVRNEIRETAFKFLDVLTLQVTMHIDREMNSMSPWTSSYSLATPDFVKYIWTFKDVPLPPDMRFKLIKMDPLNLTVTVSDKADLSNSCLRGLWFKKDFLSDLCPSYFAPLETKFETLKDSVAYERLQRNLMTEQHLNDMRAERRAWEEKMEQIRLETEKTKGAKGKASVVEQPKPVLKKSSSTKVKVDVEPSVVDEGTYVDVEEEYCAFELEELNGERKSLFPENLGLRQNELNLREYQITNGVLKLEIFQRPSQTKEISPQIFIELHEYPYVLKPEEFKVDIKLPKSIPVSNTRQSQYDKIQIDPRKKALDSLMKVELKVDEKLFWLEAPTVCRFEPWEESEDFNELDDETKDYNLRYEVYARRDAESLFAARGPCHFKTRIQLEDFDLNSEERPIKLGILFEKYIVPMMPEEYNFFAEQMEKLEQKHHEWRMIMDAKEGKKSSSDLKALYEEMKFNFDVNAITAEQFDRLFDERMTDARLLFPREYRNLIEILKGSEVSLSTSSRINEEQSPFECAKPDKFATFLLSELIQEIEKVQESLKPFFREIPEEIAAQVETEPRSFRVPQHISWRENRASRLSKRFRELERSRKPSRSRSRTRNQSQTAPQPVQSLTSSTASSTDIEIPQPTKVHPKLISHFKGKWSSKNIYDQSYDKHTKTLTFCTGRLGTFGLVIRKYANLPFKSWEIFPVVQDTKRFVKMKIETQHITIEFEITHEGFTFQITNPGKVPFSGIEAPVKIFELKKLLSSLNLNLFPEIDASFYVKDISEKHKAMELHTYKSMAVYCLSHHFKWSVWNKFADRRVAVFESRMITKSDFKLMMVTPLKAASVSIREKCTPLEVVELDYEMTPPDQEFHPDLLDFLKDEVDKKEHRRNVENFTTTWFVQALLMNVQPLSFSL